MNERMNERRDDPDLREAFRTLHEVEPAAPSFREVLARPGRRERPPGGSGKLLAASVAFILFGGLGAFLLLRDPGAPSTSHDGIVIDGVVDRSAAPALRPDPTLAYRDSLTPLVIGSLDPLSLTTPVVLALETQAALPSTGETAVLPAPELPAPALGLDLVLKIPSIEEES